MFDTLKDLLETYKWSIESKHNDEIWRDEILDFVKLQRKSSIYSYIVVFLAGVLITYLIMKNLILC
jgi:hypothetical protein